MIYCWFIVRIPDFTGDHATTLGAHSYLLVSSSINFDLFKILAQLLIETIFSVFLEIDEAVGRYHASAINADEISTSRYALDTKLATRVTDCIEFLRTETRQTSQHNPYPTDGLLIVAVNDASINHRSLRLRFSCSVLQISRVIRRYGHDK